MKYFIDFEFVEGNISQRICGFNIPRWLSKPNNTIQPISVGLVSEDGREYYAISKDFNLKEAWNRFEVKKDFGKPQGLGDVKVYWLRENVLKPIFEELAEKDNNNYFNFCKLKNNGGNNPLSVVADIDKFNYRNLKKLINKYGKTNKQIAEEIKEFCLEVPRIQKYGDPEFYAYYADYDWVAFCWLFGKMIDLPTGFPMYCKDLKQTFDEKQEFLQSSYKVGDLKRFSEYPKQENEHNALADARWNKRLHEFLNNL